jgi:hypothetical protein
MSMGVEIPCLEITALFLLSEISDSVYFHRSPFRVRVMQAVEA